MVGEDDDSDETEGRPDNHKVSTYISKLGSKARYRHK